MSGTLRAKILVLSDAAAEGRREDGSGPAVRAMLEARGWTVIECEILPDDVDRIRQRLEAWTDAGDCDAVFTTGGTGLGPRDVTPEATRAVVEKEVPGLAELMRSEGVKKNRDDQGAGVVVRRVAFRIIRNDENRVLDQSRRVGHAKQVIEFYGGKAIEILFGVLG